VNQEQRAGGYTVQLFIDPSTPGANEVHLTFVDPNGLGAAAVADITATLDAGPPVAMRLISAGHFVGDTTIPAGPHRLTVAAPKVSPPVTTTFDFKLRAGSGAGG
jgi:hypothetical protein